MPRNLKPEEEKRRQEYGAILAAIGQDQNTVASRLGVRRECICKRVNGKQPVTIEAMFALMLMAGMPLPDEDLSDLM